jgi:hypothetical protein
MAQVVLVEDVGCDDIDLVSPLNAPQPVGIVGRATYFMARSEQLRNESTPEVAGFAQYRNHHSHLASLVPNQALRR